MRSFVLRLTRPPIPPLTCIALRAPALWCVNCAILLAVQVYGKLPLSHLIPMLAPLDGWKGAARCVGGMCLCSRLHPAPFPPSDRLHTPLRWDTSYNMMMLRLLSYGLDLHWCRRAATAASTPGGATPGDKATPLPRDEQRQLASSVLLESHYSGSPFLAYILFPPLQIAGPIIPFNAFAAQQLRRRGLGAASTSPPMPAKVVAESSLAGVARYGLRFAVVWACLEWQTHAIHANAMATSSAAWRSSGLLAPAQAACVSFWALMFTWLKFTCMWRFFRLWSLAWGCVPPENMLRCVCNNYDAEGFWRGWHASFNRWLVRYLYIPLGGSSARKPLNLWLVFTFVALWHDLVEPRLLGWAWLTCLFLLPELGVKLAARLPWMSSRAHTAAYRHACAALASLNITCLMAANLVGFVIGLSGARLWLSSMLTRDGIRVLASSLLTFFSAAHIMFEVRAKESRRVLT